MSALPPKAKTTAEVWTGRSRPKVVHSRPRFSGRVGQLPGDEVAHEEADYAPGHRGDHEQADDALIVGRGARDDRGRRPAGRRE
jgi:hypothetical protein